MPFVYDIFMRILLVIHRCCGDFGLAIVIFTLLSKALLLPITIWVQKNSIKLVQMQPDINRVRIKYFGDKDSIAEETLKIYKKNGYSSVSSVVPMIIQIFILMALIGAIRTAIDTGTVTIYMGSINLGYIPIEARGLYFLAPILAGVSALLLCFVQDRMNVLQAEQTVGMRLFTLAVSVGISLLLGFFVQVAVIIYWISSNLISIVQQLLINIIMNPKKYIDYEELEKTRIELDKLGSVGHEHGKSYFDAVSKRERADYKRFFSVVNKHLVFYSESSGFYKYYKGFIEYILTKTNITIHYITSDPNDNIFVMAGNSDRIRAYYIGEKRLITLMMKMDADVVVMTMPDLENYHIKRSYIRRDIEYIYVQHDMNNHSMLMRKGCVDRFDTIFCTGTHQYDEVRQTEEVYSLPAKKLVKVGYPLIDDMRAAYSSMEHKARDRKKILIAPSWQKDNIIDTCLEEILEQLKSFDAEIIVRPHPQEVKLKAGYIDSLKVRYEVPQGNIHIQTDFSSNDTVFEANLVITDWSGICFEYAFVTYRPVLFIETPMKIMNDEWKKIPHESINITLRNQIGCSLKLGQIDKIRTVVLDMLDRTSEYIETNKSLAQKYIYNLDHSSEVGGAYIVDAVKAQIAKRKKQEVI